MAEFIARTRSFIGSWYARPSFVGGMARAIDLFGTLNYYRYYSSPEEADIDSVRRDFEAIGFDFRGAIEAEKTQMHGA